MLNEHTFDTGVVTINCAEGPPSWPPLVLLHGGGNRWQHFAPILPDLAQRCHVYALDLRGHGRSGRAPGQYRPEHYAGDVISFVESRIGDSVVLFGHSLGGWVALLAARELGQRMRALILGDPPLNMERFLSYEGSAARVAMWRHLWRLATAKLPVPELAVALADLPLSAPGADRPLRYGDLPGVDGAHLRDWAETLSQVDPDAVQYHAENRLDEYVQNVDLEEALRRCSCPVLLLQGDPASGARVAEDDVERAMSLLADGSHVRLKGMGHDLGLGSADTQPLLRAVVDFLGTL